MSQPMDVQDLIERLDRFGASLHVDDVDVSSDVVARIAVDSASRAGDARAGSRAPRVAWLAAAALVLVASAVIVQPDARRAVARWFGLDGLAVEIDPGLSPSDPSVIVEVPGPGETTIVDVDGRPIVVSTVEGRLDDGLITKTVGSSDQIEEVTVDGQRGLWISGEPHEVLYRSSDDESDDPVVEVERVAANTLLWQRDGVLYRIEGFDLLDDAIEFAEGTEWR